MKQLYRHLQLLQQMLRDRQNVQIVHNVSWLLLGHGTTIVLSAVVGIWMARHLGPERLGMLAFAVGYITLFLPLVQLGLDQVLSRELVREPHHARRLLATAVLLRLIAAAGVWVLAVGGLTLAGEQTTLVLIVGVLLFPAALDVTATWFEARVEAQHAVRIRIASLLLASIARGGAILIDASLTTFAWLVVLEALLRGVMMGLAVGRHVLKDPHTASPDRVAWTAIARRLIADSAPLMATALSLGIYMQIDLVMLNFYQGERVTGHYAIASQILGIAWFAGASVASSTFPALIKLRDMNPPLYKRRLQQLFDVLTWAGIGGALLIATNASWFVPVVFGQDFKPATMMLVVLSASLILTWPGSIFNRLVVIENWQRLMILPTLAAAAINVVGNLLLIPQLGGVGAALASILAYAALRLGSGFLFQASRPDAWMLLRAYTAPLRYLRPEKEDD